ncbi:MAG: hypothetical protein DHS20C14_21790 [Phycisphaeraceae bacterium]|nr:MAG: hypothetical protein DHS20C14_21790 [Phycisphaeraceae bacterium]
MSEVTPLGSEPNVGRVETRRSADRPGSDAEPARRRGSDRVEVSDTARLLNKLRATDAARERLGASSGPTDLDHLASLLSTLRGEGEVREGLVAEVRGLIKSEQYLTDERENGAIDGLLEDLS